MNRIEITHEAVKYILDTQIKEANERRPLSEEQLKELEELLKTRDPIVRSDSEARRIAHQMFFYKAQMEKLYHLNETLIAQRAEYYREICKLKGLCPLDEGKICPNAKNCSYDGYSDCICLDGHLEPISVEIVENPGSTTNVVNELGPGERSHIHGSMHIVPLDTIEAGTE